MDHYYKRQVEMQKNGSEDSRRVNLGWINKPILIILSMHNHRETERKSQEDFSTAMLINEEKMNPESVQFHGLKDKYQELSSLEKR
jgi:hypothetical protein